MKKPVSKILLLLGAILLIALALPASALADGGGEDGLEFTQTINGYKITLVFEKPAFVGENPIHIQILDAAGMPVTGADVEVSLEVSLEEAESDHEETETSAETGMPGMDESPTVMPTSAPDAMPGMGGMGASPAPTSTPASTPSINSMSPVNPEAEHEQTGMVALAAGHEDGEYEGEISIESDGDLVVRAHLTIQGELMEVDFPVHVAKSNTGAIVLGSFFAINVALIAAAVVMKPKPLSVTLSKKA